MSKSYYEGRDELVRTISHINENDGNLLIEIEVPDKIILSVPLDEHGKTSARIHLTFEEFEDVIREYKKFLRAQSEVKAGS